MIIDVSYHNGIIDWSKAGREIDYVILRCGYGKNIQSQDDKQFYYNATKCEKYGVPYGVYLYSYAKSEKDIISECKHVLRLLKGRNIKYPVYIDIEESGICANYNVKKYAEMFVTAMIASGYHAGLYTSNYLASMYFKDVDAPFLWIARYSKNKPTSKYTLWQYTSNGKVSGINTKVDLSVPSNDKFTTEYYTEIVNKVLSNEYGTGEARKNALFERGINYWKVQGMINTILEG